MYTWHCQVNNVSEATTAMHGVQNHGIPGPEGTNTRDLIHYYRFLPRGISHYHYTLIGEFTDLPFWFGPEMLLWQLIQVSGDSPIHLTVTKVSTFLN